MCAAWVVHIALKKCGVQLASCSYGDEFPFNPVEGDTTYIVDFSFPPEILMKIRGKVIVMDHHQTAIDKLGNFSQYNIELVLDVTRSGARIAYDYFKDRVPSNMIFIVNYVQDYDLWKFDLTNSKVVNTYFNTLSRTEFMDWDVASQQSHAEWDKNGFILLRQQRMLVEQHLDRAVPSTNGVYATINAGCLQNEIAEELLLRHKDIEYVSVYHHNDMMGRTKYSLRSRPGGYDVRAVAERFGGGGHQSAAGYVL